MLAITEAIAMGATCLDDLVEARSDSAQQQIRGFEVPAPQTAGFFLRRFTLGHLSQLNKAIEEVHLRSFKLLKLKTVTLDFDSSYLRSYSSRRQGSDPPT